MLNRLLTADFKSYSGGAWIDPGAMYNASYSYDPNGNIRTLTRDGSQSNRGPVDNLTYEYESQPVTGEESNRLQHLVETAPSPSPVAGDLEAQPIQQNYSYDEIGELTGDHSENISSISWTTYGKVASVSKLNQTIEFLYDAQGNRVRKRVYDPANPTDMAETYYVYEAGGKVVAIYENCVEPAPPGEEPDSDDDGVPDACDPDPNNGEVPPPGGDSDGDGIPDEFDPCPCTAGPVGDQDSDGIPDATDPNPCEPSCAEPYNLVEWVIYGNAAQGRIAEGKPSNVSRPASEGTPITQPDETFTRILDEKYYELKDHLGNARVVVSDMKQPTTESGLAPFSAVLSSYANYYPYGMMQPDRSWQGGGWRYGYQGQEQDNAISGLGNLISFRYRADDSRIGRFWSIDPLSDKYPWNSPFAFSENRTIDGIELEGLEVVLLGVNNAAAIGLGGQGEAGIVFGPDGVFGYGAAAIGFETNVSASAQLSVTVFPDMPSVLCAQGSGTNVGATFGEITVVSVSRVSSNGWVGVNLSLGIGGGFLPESVGGYIGFTWLTPLSKSAKDAVCIQLQQAKATIDDHIGDNNHQIHLLRVENASIEHALARHNQLDAYTEIQLKDRLDENRKTIQDQQGQNEGLKTVSDTLGKQIGRLQ